MQVGSRMQVGSPTNVLTGTSLQCSAAIQEWRAGDYLRVPKPRRTGEGRDDCGGQRGADAVCVCVCKCICVCVYI